MILAPVLLFCYNRLWHINRTISALRNNVYADKTELFIFSDGPRNSDDARKILHLREYLKKVDGFKKVTIIEREMNGGISNSIINGVTELINQYGKVIVLEDDMITSHYFIKYMNDALVLYETENRVISIHGYVYPVKGKLPETFFLRGADCWGWATWKRGWDLFEKDGGELLNGMKEQKLINAFNFNGSFRYSRMLERQIKGKNDSWAIRWYASAFLKDKLTLYPGVSLVHNIGLDDSGTHCFKRDDYDVDVKDEPVRLEIIPIVESKVARDSFEDFFRHGRKFAWGVIWKVLKGKV